MKTNRFGSIGVICAFVTMATLVTGCPCINPVIFQDPALEDAVRDTLGLPLGILCADDVRALTSLDARGFNIISLGGLEECTALQTLDLSSNSISDISAISSLTNLRWLDLSDNLVANLEPLKPSGPGAQLPLQHLDLANNEIGDIQALADLYYLRYLDLSGNDIRDLNPLVTNASNNGLGSFDDTLVTVSRTPLLDTDGEFLSAVADQLDTLDDLNVPIVFAEGGTGN